MALSVKLLDGAAATGVGTIELGNHQMDLHTITVEFTNSGGSVTVLKVDLEGTINGTKYFPLYELTFSPSQLTAKFAEVHIVDKFIAAVRGNVKTLTATGTTAITMEYLGK